MNGFTKIPGSIGGFEKPGKNRSSHIHYNSITGSNNTEMVLEVFTNASGKITHKSRWVLGRFACGNKESMREIIRKWELKYPGHIYKIRGYGGNKPGHCVVYEIMEKVRS